MIGELLCRLGVHNEVAKGEIMEDGRLYIYLECKRCGYRPFGRVSTFQPGKYMEVGKITAGTIDAGTIIAERGEPS